MLEQLPVTIQELRDTGVGKTINKLMKHPDSEISRSCDQLKQKWVALNAVSRVYFLTLASLF